MTIVGPRKPLLENDEGLKGVILSLSSLISLLMSDETIASLIAESKKRPPLSFVFWQIHKLRNYLGLPSEHLQGELNNLETYANDIYNYLCGIGTTVIAAPIFLQTDTIPEILGSLEQQRPDLGPIDWLQVTTIDYAIMIGVSLGNTGHYLYPRIASQRMANIGTAVVRRVYDPKSMVFKVHPHQQGQPHAPHLGSDSDAEDHSSGDIGYDTDDDASPQCRREPVPPASSPASSFCRPASNGVAKIGNEVSKLHLSKEGSGVLDHDVPDAGNRRGEEKSIFLRP